MNAPTLEPTPEATGVGQGPRVLIVEDDPNNRWVLCALFRRMGYDCQVARGGGDPGGQRARGPLGGPACAMGVLLLEAGEGARSPPPPLFGGGRGGGDVEGLRYRVAPPPEPSPTRGQGTRLDPRARE